MFETPLDEKAALLSETSAHDVAETTISPQEPSGQADFLIPANMSLQSTGSPTGGAPGPGLTAKRDKRAKGAHHNYTSPNADIDEYFKEGEQKSREEDRSAPTKSGALPPPPKTMGPPRSATPSKSEAAT